LVDISGDGLVNYLEPGIPETEREGILQIWWKNMAIFWDFDGIGECDWHLIFYGFYGILR
jgi:hypothetical protein